MPPLRPPIPDLAGFPIDNEDVNATYRSLLGDFGFTPVPPDRRTWGSSPTTVMECWPTTGWTHPLVVCLRQRQRSASTSSSVERSSSSIDTISFSMKTTKIGGSDHVVLGACWDCSVNGCEGDCTIVGLAVSKEGRINSTAQNSRKISGLKKPAPRMGSSRPLTTSPTVALVQDSTTFTAGTGVQGPAGSTAGGRGTEKAAGATSDVGEAGGGRTDVPDLDAEGPAGEGVREKRDRLDVIDVIGGNTTNAPNSPNSSHLKVKRPRLDVTASPTPLLTPDEPIFPFQSIKDILAAAETSLVAYHQTALSEALRSSKQESRKNNNATTTILQNQVKELRSQLKMKEEQLAKEQIEAIKMRQTLNQTERDLSAARAGIMQMLVSRSNGSSDAEGDGEGDDEAGLHELNILQLLERL